MRSQWGASANPHAKVFDSPSTPKSHPGAWPWQQNENSVQYVFYLLFVRTRKVWYKNLWNWHVNDIWPFDLAEGHQFDSRMKMLLAFCSAHHPYRFDMLHDHVWKKKMFDPLGTPSAPKSDPWGMTQATEKNPFWYIFCLSFVRTHTKFGI